MTWRMSTDSGAWLPGSHPGPATQLMCDRRLSGLVCKVGAIDSTSRAVGKLTGASAGVQGTWHAGSALCFCPTVVSKTSVQNPSTVVFMRPLVLFPVYCVGIHVNLKFSPDFTVNPQDPGGHCPQQNCMSEQLPPDPRY